MSINRPFHRNVRQFTAKKLPDHLRRETALLKPDMDVSGLQKMGEEVTEVLDYYRRQERRGTPASVN